MADNKKQIPSRYKWIFDKAIECHLDILEDKPLLISKYYIEALKKLLTIFKYTKIPKTISKRTLELFILGGYAKIFRFKNEWYCGCGGFSGVNTYDYIPISATLTNTYLNYSKTLEVVTPFNKDDINESNIEKYCFIIPNDELYSGLLVEASYYARMQVECDLTIAMILYNMRVPVLSVANDDTTKNAFDLFKDDIVNGRFGVSFRGNKLFDALKTLPYNNQHLGALKEVIECKQYLKATFENNIGLNANYNMKREKLNDDEIALNDDNLLPNIDDMNDNRKKGYELLNEVSKRIYGETTIEFERNSSWKNRQDEIEIEFKKQEAEIEEIANTSNENEVTNNDISNETDNE